MKVHRILFLLTLLAASLSCLPGETVLPIPATSLDSGAPGNDPPAYRFTLETDGPVTIKAMFMTHWLANRSNVVSNPKATRFVIDGKPYPSTEDFYGYMDERLWPERALHTSQQIWVNETVQLSKGPHFIEFHNGLMERDNSSSSAMFSFTNWMTASLHTEAFIRKYSIDVNFLYLDSQLSIHPENEIVTIGTSLIYTFITKDALVKQFVGTDGTYVIEPTSNYKVSPGIGHYVYTLTANSNALISWSDLGSDQLWIDLPSGSSVDVTKLRRYVANTRGNYTFRHVTAGVTESQTIFIDPPTKSVTATLTVIPAAPVTSGPVITEFTPIAADYTATTGPAAGHTYKRSWKSDNGWAAYLGREGVSFHATGRSDTGEIRHFELQAKAPSGDWYTLGTTAPDENAPNTIGREVPGTFRVKLGEVQPSKPLVPADPSLAGTWSIRARVSDSAGNWSPWAFEQPLQVIMPIKDLTLPTRTLPPVQDAEWFSASPIKPATFHVLVP